MNTFVFIAIVSFVIIGLAHFYIDAHSLGLLNKYNHMFQKWKLYRMWKGGYWFYVRINQDECGWVHEAGSHKSNYKLDMEILENPVIYRDDYPVIGLEAYQTPQGFGFFIELLLLGHLSENKFENYIRRVVWLHEDKKRRDGSAD